MPFIMGSWKILQRRAYDLLSHKYSFIFVLLGFLTLTVSVIQFGEVWIERNQSDNFNSFSDNVVGKSLQKKLCQIVPIDVVYTWVNGSDPLLLQQMLDYKKSLLKGSVMCQFTHCIPSHMVAFRGWFKKKDMKYNHKNIQIKHPDKSKELHNWTLVALSSPEDAKQAVVSSIDLENHNSTLTHAYWTSDHSAPYSYFYPNAVIVTSLSAFVLSKLRDISPNLIAKENNLLINKMWVDMEVKVVILEFPTPPSSSDLQKISNLTILGHKVNASKAYLVLELAPLWDIQDLAPSRFEDKEELRYSMRSLEIYAPWVRHVYLVTNGQIPYWLNLDNPKLTLLTHEDIFPDRSHLPTFSSPSIESHIHRIPGLSQQFLYLNDDVFFGQEVWPEDFITYARGQKVYLSWPVPDCSESCPWSWIGDGSCDVSCNISDCAFDGGDCNPSNGNIFPNEDFYDEHHLDTLDSPLHDHLLLDDSHIDLNDLHNLNWGRETDADQRVLHKQENSSLSVQKNTLDNVFHGHNNTSTYAETIENPKAYEDKKRSRAMKYVERTNLESSSNSTYKETTVYKKLISQESKTENQILQRTWKLNRQLKTINSSDSLSGTKKTEKYIESSVKQRKKNIPVHNSYNSKDIASWGYKRAKDTFAESLLFVNRLYNNEFGFEVRKVPAHMPHLIDKTIMEHLQNRFPLEWERTSAHKIRNVQDMQFAFSYFYFLMSEKINRTIDEIFNIFDTDQSGTWSDREIRTLLTQLNDLPLSYHKVIQFEEQICNCSLLVGNVQYISTPPYERYQDSKLPVVSKMLIHNCEPVKLALLEKFGSHKKYKTEVIKDKSQTVTFKMLSSNLSQLIVMLDEVRRDPKKFVCLNDNLDPNLKKDNAIVRAVLQDFYESLFPMPSSFELPLEYRNRFLHISELMAWRSGRTVLRNGIYACIFFLMIFTALSFFQVECCSFQRRRRKIYQDV